MVPPELFAGALSRLETVKFRPWSRITPSQLESLSAQIPTRTPAKEAPASTTPPFQSIFSTSKSLKVNLSKNLSQLLNPNMAKRMLSDEPNRKFVHKTEWSEITETICVEIHNFTEKIDDLENKKPFNSPKC